MAYTDFAPRRTERQRLSGFGRVLPVWILLCMVAGLALNTSAPATFRSLRSTGFGRNSRDNVLIASFVWLMVIPMMMRVNFGMIRDSNSKPRGPIATLSVNWLVKPLSLAVIAWVFLCVGSK